MNADAPQPHLSMDPALSDRLRSLAGRVRGCVLVEGAAWLVWFVVAAVTVQSALDYVTRGMRRSIRWCLEQGQL